MKFYVTFFFVCVLHEEGIALVYLAKNFKQVIPMKQQRIVRLLPFRRCLRNNIFYQCEDITRRGYSMQDKPKVNFMIHKEKQLYDGDRLLRKQTNPVFPLKDENIYELDAFAEENSDVKSLAKNEIYKNKNKYSVINAVKEKQKLAETVELDFNVDIDTATTNNTVITNKIPTKDKSNYDTRIEPALSNQDMPSETKVTFNHKNNMVIKNNFKKDLILALNQFERQLYLTNFMKFSSITPASKGDNGMSFAQSGLFLEMALMALSTEVDLKTKNEIDQNFAFKLSDLEKVKLIRQVISSLPKSSKDFKFLWSSHLVLRSRRQLSQNFMLGAAQALQLKINHFKDGLTTQNMANVLNRMIEVDSGGAIRDTFDEDDLVENEEAVLITTLYFRARWRTAPTLLNGTWLFRSSGDAPSTTIKMMKVNDLMKYVDLPEWDAEAIEIPYLTEGLSLLMLVPRGNSLKRLVEHVAVANLTSSVTEKMQDIRIAASIPLYTLRVTLLLPNKLQAMGLSRIVNVSESEDDSLRLSQAVQRIMFWVEAGRNAFKDDGLEWDETPEMNISIDRPYMFFVRWQNLNLIAGNFVL